MSVFNRYGLYPMRIGDILARQIGSADYKSAATKSEVYPGGLIDRSAVITAYADPMFTVKSPDLSMLTSIGLTAGYIYDTGLGSPTASSLMQFQERLDGGTFAGAGVGAHILLTSTKGFAAPSDLSVSQDDVNGAQITFDIWALSPDGLTEPVTAVSTGSLTSTPLFNGFHYLGPVMIGDPAGSHTRLKGVQSVKINPGIEYAVKRGDGHPFSSIGSIVRRSPEIRITMADPSQLYTSSIGAIPLFGKAIVAGIRVSCYFQAGIHGGQRVPEATASHYCVTAQTGDLQFDSISVQDNQDGSVDLVVRPTGVIALTSSVAIP